MKYQMYVTTPEMLSHCRHGSDTHGTGLQEIKEMNPERKKWLEEAMAENMINEVSPSFPPTLLRHPG